MKALSPVDNSGMQTPVLPAKPVKSLPGKGLYTPTTRIAALIAVT
jgi:hypothetical protein